MESIHTPDATLRGVRGWLLLLVLSLTIFSPLATLYNLVSGYDQSGRHIGQFPSLQTIEWIDVGLSSALMCLSIYAGVGLWSIRPNAAKQARSLLLLYPGYYAVVIAVVSGSDLPLNLRAFVIGPLSVGLVRAAVFSAVWRTYLSKSKRVRATYYAPVIPVEAQLAA